mmetsp:Transcript_95149/g.268853  ORF Transcript_95149/g.268853 Transcript_95149/m.268853 type:complete len:396 (-) Transcript_95149:160-1347(-)
MMAPLPDRRVDVVAARTTFAPGAGKVQIDRSRHHFRPHAHSAFRTVSRPLFIRGGSAPSARNNGGLLTGAPQGAPFPQRFTLVDLPEGPCLNATMYLDACSLCKVDTTCRFYRALNQSHFGPWRVLGARAFHGVELERDGVYELAEGPRSPVLRGNKCSRLDWKGRYWRFKKELPTFRPPFHGQEIKSVGNPDEVAYCRCMLRADVLAMNEVVVDGGARGGVYIEIEVVSNPDNLSLAVVDFEAGGHSSVTFSPDTGAVIRERKVQEVPRQVQGSYIQPLPATLPGRRFEGFVGLYLYEGRLAFLRRCATDETGQQPPWETTGFVTDLGWAEGRCLTPCLAFRDEGEYHVKIVRVGSQPPLAPGQYDEANWSVLDWEAGDATQQAGELLDATAWA